MNKLTNEEKDEKGDLEQGMEGEVNLAVSLSGEIIHFRVVMEVVDDHILLRETFRLQQHILEVDSLLFLALEIDHQAPGRAIHFMLDFVIEFQRLNMAGNIQQVLVLVFGRIHLLLQNLVEVVLNSIHLLSSLLFFRGLIAFRVALVSVLEDPALGIEERKRPLRRGSGLRGRALHFRELDVLFVLISIFDIQGANNRGTPKYGSEGPGEQQS